jgi:glycine/D-amino acid oxidase-like deaminating enzyme
VDEGVNLHTETPVTNVRPGDQGKWIVETTRGNIITSHVVHATNGYVQSLLPKFSPITSIRGFMTSQIPPKSLSHPPLDRTYCFIHKWGYEYLIQQPVEDGSKLMMGGGMVQDPNPKSSDDGDVPAALEHYLRNQLPNVLHWEGENHPDERLDMAWSGIMGFSKDSSPWVGALPESVGGGAGQWICAGYTGEGIDCKERANLGMINAPLCAEALAIMLLGKQLPADFPRSYLVTEERIQNLKKGKEEEAMRKGKLPTQKRISMGTFMKKVRGICGGREMVRDDEYHWIISI